MALQGLVFIFWRTHMKVFKSINNNIVSAFDDDGKEVVVIGKGIGFRAKKGDAVIADKIEKIFLMRSQNETERMKELFASLPVEYIEITDEILTYAKETLKRRINEGAYITLADHINFTVMRFKQGMNFQNVLLTEIRRFYPQEYGIGLFALKLMENRLGITMPEDEAASIALHIFNAEYDISISDAFHSTKLLDRILDIITKEFGYAMDEDNYYCERFITHLKFLTQRIVRKEHLPKGDEEFYKMVMQNYQKETHCSKKIAEYVRKEEEYEMSLEEISSLTIHIKKISTSN